MKKTILSITLILISYIAYSQDNNAFEKYEENNEVTTIVVTKQAFLMLKKVASESKEGQEYKRLVSGLNELKVYTTQNKKVATDIRLTYDNYVKSRKMMELMRVKDKDANIKIYVKQGKSEDMVTEFIMIVDEIETTLNKGGATAKPELVVVSLTGDINLNDIAKITAEMNIPGNEYVKKTK